MTVAADHLSWSDPTGQAVCYLVISNGKAMLTTDEQLAYDGSSDISVQSVSQYGVLGCAVTPAIAAGVTQPTIGAQPASPIYNLQGQRLSQPQQGVNISDGRKFVKR